MRLVILAGAAVLALVAGTAATAQMGSHDPVHGRAVAAEIKKLLDANYVLPGTRPKFDAVLAKGIAAGRYDISDAGELVNRLNADLHTVTADKHLDVMYD